MNEKLKISKFLIVGILLAAYSCIYFTDFLCLCNLEHSKLIASEQNHPRSEKKHHGENTGKEQHNNKNSKSDGCCSGGCDCCKKLTSFFIADLPKLVSPPLELKVKTFNAPSFIYNISISKYDYLTSQLTPYHYKLPPPKIPDIRVFIQSFII